MHRRTLLTFAAGAGLAGPLGLGRPALAAPGPSGSAPGSASSGRCLTVAADGTGDLATIQAAVDAVPDGNTAPFVIDVAPGVYAGQVIIPASKPFIVLVGRGTDPGQVVITDDRANGTLRPDGTPWGTSGSASVTIDAGDFTARNLTFANSFDEAAHPEIANRQAVAVLTRADRLIFDGVRFLGNQDTLYVNSKDAATPGRSYLRGCYVEGDVDFIFGRGTAVFDRSRIHALSRGSSSNNGYITAASTSIGNPYGLLFSDCDLTSNAPAATFSLGRPWHPSQDPNAIAQTVIRDSRIGAHVGASPWTDFGTWSWRDARYAEYRNTGPGAVPSADRPQLSDADAARFTVSAYLAGSDGWAPHLRTRRR